MPSSAHPRAAVPILSWRGHRIVTRHGLFIALPFAIFALQAAVRVAVFHAARFIVVRGIVVHAALLASAIGLIVLALVRWRRSILASRWCILAVAAGLGLLHAAFFLIDTMQYIYLSRGNFPIPFDTLMRDPGIVLSLISYVGLSDTQCAAIIAAILSVFIGGYALYLTRACRSDPARSVLAAWIDRLPRRRLALLGLVVATPVLGVAAVPNQLKYDPYGVLIAAKDPMAPETMMYVRRDRRVPIVYPSGGSARPRPLILIVVDAMRADAIGADTPYLQRLVRQGWFNRFDHAYSTCTYSICGVMSILTSRYWDDFGVAPAVLPDLLQPLGYRSYFLLSGDHRHFAGLRTLFGDNIAIYRDDNDSAGLPSDDARLPVWLRSIRFERPQSSFVYLHLMSAHEGSTIAGRRSNWRLGRNVLDRAAARRAFVAHSRAGVRQADRIVRQLLQVLSDKGMLDEAVVVITADHGDRLSPGAVLGHGGDPDRETLSVPLLLHVPGDPPLRTDRPVSTIDIAPTLLATIGMRPPVRMTGRSLLDRDAVSYVPVGTARRHGEITAGPHGPVLSLTRR